MTEVTLRPAAREDEPQLFALYCVNMHDVVARTWGWDEAWQSAEFSRRFGELNASVIEAGSRLAGFFFVERRTDSLYIHELQVAPSYQSRGIGTAVVEAIIAEAADNGLAVALSVVAANPRARRLYDRLGFRATAEEPPFVRMRHDGRPAVSDAGEAVVSDGVREHATGAGVKELVEVSGLEPLTFWLPARRSPS